jgi:hypothetical protein
MRRAIAVLFLTPLAGCVGAQPAGPEATATAAVAKADEAAASAQAAPLPRGAFYMGMGLHQEVLTAFGDAGVAGVFSTSFGYGVDNLRVFSTFRAGYPWDQTSALTMKVNGREVPVMDISIGGADADKIFDAFDPSVEQATDKGAVRQTGSGRVSCTRIPGSASAATPTSTWCTITQMVSLQVSH